MIFPGTLFNGLLLNHDSLCNKVIMDEVETLIVELTTRLKAELLMSIKAEAEVLMHD